MIAKALNTSFLFDQIRAYNKATKPKLKDKILSAVGIYTGLLDDRVRLRGITEEERQTVHSFLSAFCEFEGLKVEIAQSRICVIRAQLEGMWEAKL